MYNLSHKGGSGMEVYVDVIIIENIIVDLFLMLVTLKLLRIKYKTKSLYFSSILGSLYTLTTFMDFNLLNNVVIKILVAFIMIYITVEKKKLINVIKGTIVFFIVAFTLGGLIFAIVMKESTYNIEGDFIIKGISIKWIFFSVLILGIVIIRIYDSIKDMTLLDNFIYDICIKINENTLLIKGYLDTGNELREPVTNLPCILVEKEYLSRLNINSKDKFLIGCKTINGKNILSGFKGESVKIKPQDDIEWKDVEAIICECDNGLSKENNYQALLSIGVI